MECDFSGIRTPADAWMFRPSFAGSLTRVPHNFAPDAAFSNLAGCIGQCWDIWHTPTKQVISPAQANPGPALAATAKNPAGKLAAHHPTPSLFDVASEKWPDYQDRTAAVIHNPECSPSPGAKGCTTRAEAAPEKNPEVQEPSAM